MARINIAKQETSEEILQKVSELSNATKTTITEISGSVSRVKTADEILLRKSVSGSNITNNDKIHMYTYTASSAEASAAGLKEGRIQVDEPCVLLGAYWQIASYSDSSRYICHTLEIDGKKMLLGVRTAKAAGSEKFLIGLKPEALPTGLTHYFTSGNSVDNWVNYIKSLPDSANYNVLKSTTGFYEYDSIEDTVGKEYFVNNATNGVAISAHPSFFDPLIVFENSLAFGYAEKAGDSPNALLATGLRNSVFVMYMALEDYLKAV